MNETVTEANGPQQTRPVYYEPRHDEHTAGQVRAALGERGYVPTGDDEIDLAVFVAGDGGLTLHDGDWGTDLAPLGLWGSAAEYADAIADWIESADGGAARRPGEPREVHRPWRGGDGRVDLAVVRRMIADGPLIGEADSDYTEDLSYAAGALCDEVEQLRADRAAAEETIADLDARVSGLSTELQQARHRDRCPKDPRPRPCRPYRSVYGTVAATLGDYDGRLGDAAVETHLARCRSCGAAFVGLTPGGVYPDEDDFADRVEWVRVAGAAEEVL